ncbi:MAG: tetratricopeptide repeat protein [Xanthomonadales bacterium]|nr:tetratricopeptide repeat protein [Xanthomonadales bacterium]
MKAGRKEMIRRNLPVGIFLVAFLLLWPGVVSVEGWADWWLTADQQGQRLFRQERYLEAAEVFETPEYKGVAFFRGGDFESAASVFGRLRTPEAAYNRGNSVLMLGRYDEAIQAYEDALQARPGWKEAAENLAIARVRKERLAPPEDDAGGTGGQLEADEIVFDDSGRVNKSGTGTETEGGQQMSDDEMRAVWLRRVQNDPAEFLRTRFAYQLFRDQQGSQEGTDEADGD